MRQLFFKLLPYALGGILGVLVVFPPASFDELGLWKVPILGGILLLGLLATVSVQMLVGLPQDPAVEPVHEAPPREAAHLIAQLQALGFETIEPSLRIDLRPPATIVVMMNRAAACWASVFVTGTLPRRVGYDILSVVEGKRGTMTSLADPAAAVLPVPPGHFKQVIRGASPQELLTHHQRAVDFLASRGVSVEQPDGQDVAGRVRRSLVLQRQVVTANPLKAAAVTLWRATTKRTPFDRALASQAGVEAGVLHLRGQTAPAA